jgi:hypothetical protein
MGQKTERMPIPLSVSGGSDRVNIIVRVFPTSRVVASGPFTIFPGGVMDVTLPSDENMLGVVPNRTQIGKQ